MTRAEIIEQYFLSAFIGPAPARLHEAAIFADQKQEDQNAILESWALSRKTELEAQALAQQNEVDALNDLAVDIDASVKGLP